MLLRGNIVMIASVESQVESPDVIETVSARRAAAPLVVGAVVAEETLSRRRRAKDFAPGGRSSTISGSLFHRGPTVRRVPRGSIGDESSEKP